MYDTDWRVFFRGSEQRLDRAPKRVDALDFALINDAIYGKGAYALAVRDALDVEVEAMTENTCREASKVMADYCNVDADEIPWGDIESVYAVTGAYGEGIGHFIEYFPGYVGETIINKGEDWCKNSWSFIAQEADTSELHRLSSVSHPVRVRIARERLQLMQGARDAAETLASEAEARLFADAEAAEKNMGDESVEMSI